jgi:predicted transcriptional regulator
MAESAREDGLVELAAAVVSAYVSHNSLGSADLPRLIGEVHAALAGLTGAAPVAVAEPARPAVPVRRSIAPDYVVCLEDGKKFRSLKRHLRTSHDLTPEQYRAKWNLPRDYPMVAPNYSEQRTQLAKQIGLGTTANAERSTSKRRGRRSEAKA